MWELETNPSVISGLAERFGATPNEVRRATARAFRVKGQQAEAAIKRSIRDQFKIRTGSLWNAIGYQVVIDSDGWPSLTLGAIHEPPPHLAVQEFGKVIRGNPWLTVPIEHPRNPMLSQSGGAKDGGAGGVYARDIRDSPAQFGLRGTFVAHGVIFGVPIGFSSKRTKGMGMGKGAGGWNIIPIAVLKASVTIPARPFLRPVFERIEAELPDEIAAQVGLAVLGRSET